MSRYDVKSILDSSTLPIGGAAKRLKDMEQVELSVDGHRTEEDSMSITSHLTEGINSYGSASTTHHHAAAAWHGLSFQQQQPYNTTNMHNLNYPYGQRLWCKQEQDSSDHTFSSDIHQLQLGNSTHNFFQPNSGLHTIMGMDSTSMDNSSGSNSVVYGGDGISNNGYGGGSGSYMIPMGTTTNDGNQNQRGFGDSEIKSTYGYESVFGSTDPYNTHARNMYYQQSSVDQGSSCNNNNNWIPTAIPTLAPRPNNMALCPPFTLLHE